MDGERRPVMEDIISLTLEVVHLLTGEDYGVVRKSGESSAGGPRGLQPALLENDRKILEVSNKIIHLLTGEVWKFLGQADQNSEPVTAAGQTDATPEPAKFLQTETTANEIKEEAASGQERALPQIGDLKPVVAIDGAIGEDVASRDGGPFTDGDISTAVEPEDASDDQEMMSRDEQSSAPAEHYAPPDPQRPAFNHIKDELVGRAEENLPRRAPCSVKEEEPLSEGPGLPDVYKHADVQYAAHVKAETPMYEEGGATGGDFYAQTDYTVPGVDEDSDPEIDTGQRAEAPSGAILLYNGTVPSQPLPPQITVTVDGAHQCSQCGKLFTRNSDLMKHQRAHQRAQPIICTECGKIFTKKSQYIRHQRTHTGEKPYSCADCGKCFAVSAHLTTHQRIHTGEKPFVCVDCGKSFNQKASMIKHRRTHTGEKPFVCSVCGKCFTSSANLTLHQRVHTGEKPYSCSVCGKSFRSSPNLISHQRIHTGEKPYSCSVCNKFFTNSSVLVRHHRTHTGEKPYLCSECGKGFTRNSLLIKHQLIHRGQRPYACT